MKFLLEALRFLTVLPLPTARQADQADLRNSLYAFVLVGLLIGGFLAILAWGLGRALPAFPLAVFLVFAMLLVSGGLHMDGLADSADGLLSSRPRERILEIMRDSRVGPMGVMAVVGMLLAKTSMLAGIALPVLYKTVFLMPLAGRTSLVILIACFPYARKSTAGLGRAFYGGGKTGSVLVSLTVSAAAGWLVYGLFGVLALGISVAGTLVFGLYTLKKIGGSTGDTLGAGCEISEMLVALVVVVLHHNRMV